MTKQPWLDEDSEWMGYWWLPDDPEHRVPGVLRYIPKDGLHLTLIGGFEHHEHHKVDGGTAVTSESKTWPVLWGATRNASITLFDCFPIHSVSSLFKLDQEYPDEQAISATTALIGLHLRNRFDAIFTKCIVSVENLTMWSNSSPFTSSFGIEDGRYDGTCSITLGETQSPPTVVDGTTAMLGHEITMSAFNHTRAHSTASIMDAAFVSFTPEAPIALADAEAWAGSLQDLVSLAMDRACSLLRLELRIPLDVEQNPSGYPIHDNRVLVYAQGITLGDTTAPAVDQRDIVFSCKDIPFDALLPRWWAARTRFSTAIDMLLGLKYAPAQYVESNLLSATGAAEVFHRSLSTTGADASPVDPMTAQSEQRADGQENPTKSAHPKKRTILRERLRDLASRPDSQAMEFLLPAADTWAATTAHIRNAITHDGQAPKNTSDELYAIVMVTTAVVTMNLLQELGLPSDLQRKVVREHPAFQHATDLARKALPA